MATPGWKAKRQALTTRRSASAQLAKPAARLAPELTRRHALDLQEAAVEVGDVVEAHVVADVGDVAVRLHQQQARAADTQAVHEVDEVVSGRAAEKAREAALAHPQLHGEVAQRRRPRDVLGEPIDDAADQLERSIVITALQLRARQELVIRAACEVTHELTERAQTFQPAAVLDRFEIAPRP